MVDACRDGAGVLRGLTMLRYVARAVFAWLDGRAYARVAGWVGRLRCTVHTLVSVAITVTIPSLDGRRWLQRSVALHHGGVLLVRDAAVRRAVFASAVATAGAPQREATQE